jgi:hypothetical protein
MVGKLKPKLFLYLKSKRTIKTQHMKKVKLNGKFSLKKETVVRLTDFQLKQIKGGEEEAIFHSRLLCAASNDTTKKNCCLQ